MILAGTALALGSFRSDDPLVVIPMLIISGIAFAGLCIWHEGGRIPRIAVGAVIVVALVFIGWRDLRKPEPASAIGPPQNTKTLEPELSLTIDEIAVTGDGRDNSKSDVIVVASIANKGEPVKIANWGLQAITAYEEHAALPILLNSNDHISYQTAPGEVTEISDSDALDTRTANNPVQNVMPMRGILLFSFATPAQELRRAGTRFMLSCVDVNGRITRTTYSFQTETDSKRPLTYLPGLTPFNVKKIQGQARSSTGKPDTDCTSNSSYDDVHFDNMEIGMVNIEKHPCNTYHNVTAKNGKIGIYNATPAQQEPKSKPPQ